METLSEEEHTQLLIRAGVDLSKDDYVDTGNLLDVITRLQTRLDGNVHARDIDEGMINMRAVTLIWENPDGEQSIQNFSIGELKEWDDYALKRITVPDTAIIPVERPA